MIHRKRYWIILIILVFCLAVNAHGAECDHEFEAYLVEPGCEDPGLTYEECILCGYQRNYQSVDPLGHNYGEWYVEQEPTCTQEGTKARICDRCGDKEQAPIDHLGHSYTVYVMPPTCTARGYTQHYCEGCGDRYRTDYVDATGHQYDDGVVTKEPTLTAMGRITYTCMNCGDTYQETIPMLTNPFEDIDEDAYYFNAVIWAVNVGITSGMDETHFGPELDCTRAQVVTFLWRAAGKPEPENRAFSFVDVAQDAYYRDAVLWAWQQGITLGVDDVHFGPEDTCTRAQVVTFLHRAAGYPDHRGVCSFPDVHQGDYFFEAVCWACEIGVTVGSDGGRFEPHQTCTRGQIVTFLYRAEKGSGT